MINYPILESLHRLNAPPEVLTELQQGEAAALQNFDLTLLTGDDEAEPLAQEWSRLLREQGWQPYINSTGVFF